MCVLESRTIVEYIFTVHTEILLSSFEHLYVSAAISSSIYTSVCYLSDYAVFADIDYSDKI